jgi:alpha-L-fucosidase
MFEQDLPGENSAGFNTAPTSELPFETCRTINNSWGLNTKDQAHRPIPDLIRYLVQAAGRDANLLLNTGPTAEGEILPEHRERYLAIGRWLKQYGDTIYGTRGGPIRPQPWGVTTHRGSRIYLHVLNWPEGGALRLPAGVPPIRSARGLRGEVIPVEQTTAGTRLTLPPGLKDPIDTIVVVDLRDPLPAAAGK